MSKAPNPRLVPGNEVHARATVVFKSKQDCRRYIGADFHNGYVNGVVKDVDHCKDKRGKTLQYPVIDFRYGGIAPKRVVLALSQVKAGRCPGVPTDNRECFFKIVGADGMKQTRIEDAPKVILPKKSQKLSMIGASAWR